MADVGLNIRTAVVTRSSEQAASSEAGGSGLPSGAASGDLSGVYPQPTLAESIVTAVNFSAAQITGNSIYQGKAIADAYISSAANWNAAYGWGNHSTAGYALLSGANFGGDVKVDSIFEVERDYNLFRIVGTGSTVAIGTTTNSSLQIAAYGGTAITVNTDQKVDFAGDLEVADSKKIVAQTIQAKNITGDPEQQLVDEYWIDFDVTGIYGGNYGGLTLGKRAAAAGEIDNQPYLRIRADGAYSYMLDHTAIGAEWAQSIGVYNDTDKLGNFGFAGTGPNLDYFAFGHKNFRPTLPVGEDQGRAWWNAQNFLLLWNNGKIEHIPPPEGNGKPVRTSASEPPEAWFTLGKGTTDYAPLRFKNPDALKTTAEEGDFEYYNNVLYITDSATRRAIHTSINAPTLAGNNVMTGFNTFNGNVLVKGSARFDNSGSYMMRFLGGQADTVISRISANNIENNKSDFGFSLVYQGSGNDNNNDLVLFADNQSSSTQAESFRVKQSGEIIFKDNISTESHGTSSNWKEAYDWVNNNSSNVAYTNVSNVFSGDQSISDGGILIVDNGGSPHITLKDSSSIGTDASSYMITTDSTNSNTSLIGMVGDNLIISAYSNTSGISLRTNNIERVRLTQTQVISENNVLVNNYLSVNHGTTGQLRISNVGATTSREWWFQVRDGGNFEIRNNDLGKSLFSIEGGNANVEQLKLRSTDVLVQDDFRVTGYIYSTGDIVASSGATIGGLAGSGTRMVVANSSGVLSTQSIPSGELDIDSLSTVISFSDLDTDDKLVISVDGTNMGITTSLLAGYFEQINKYESLYYEGSSLRVQSTLAGANIVGELDVDSTVKTAAPTGSSAHKWKLGAAHSGSINTFQGKVIKVEVDGVVYDLMVAEAPGA